MKRILVFLASLSLIVTSARGDLIQEFKTDTTDAPTFLLAGSTYTRSLNGLVADGVTFDAVLTLSATAQGGGAGTMNVISSGVGIDGAGSDLVSDGELVSFAMSVSNFVGGTVAFNGFTAIDFNNFGAGDSGVLSLDASEATAGDNFFTTNSGGDIENISATSPTAFSAIASAGALNSLRSMISLQASPVRPPPQCLSHLRSC